MDHLAGVMVSNDSNNMWTLLQAKVSNSIDNQHCLLYRVMYLVGNKRITYQTQNTETKKNNTLWFVYPKLRSTKSFLYCYDTIQ